MVDHLQGFPTSFVEFHNLLSIPLVEVNMRFFSVLAAAVSLSLGGLVFAAPTTLKSVERYQGEVSGKYIVKFKDGVSRTNLVNSLRSDLAVDDLEIINAIAGKSVST